MNLRRDVFQALADPTRRAILILLASQPMSAGTIASNFDVARPTISKHIKVLTECDLLKANQQGREIYYQVSIAELSQVDQWLAEFRKVWENRFDQLDEVLLTMKNKKL